MSWPLGDDMARAVSYLREHCAIRSIVWQAAGSTFCAGASPYSASEPSSLAASVRLVFDYKVRGFVLLSNLPVPVFCAVHGSMVGGGVAMSLRADARICEKDALFQHGNLSRGVCPVAGFSKTLQTAVGVEKSFALYLNDHHITAGDALALGLVQEVHCGVEVVKRRTFDLATCANSGCAIGSSIVYQRDTTPLQLLADEVLRHCECLAVNGGLRLGRAGAESPRRHQGKMVSLDGYLLTSLFSSCSESSSATAAPAIIVLRPGIQSSSRDENDIDSAPECAVLCTQLVDGTASVISVSHDAVRGRALGARVRRQP